MADLDSDPFCYDGPDVSGTPPPAPASLTITGLSEEEDAQRHMALRFDPSLRLCPNCEVVFDKSKLARLATVWCPDCGDTLRSLDQGVRQRKFISRYRDGGSS